MEFYKLEWRYKDLRKSDKKKSKALKHLFKLLHALFPILREAQTIKPPTSWGIWIVASPRKTPASPPQ